MNLETKQHLPLNTSNSKSQNERRIQQTKVLRNKCQSAARLRIEMFTVHANTLKYK